MSDIQVWEMLDSMSGSVANEGEQGETREVKRRYLIGQTEGFTDTVAQIETYAPGYVDDGQGGYWVRRRLEVQGVGNRYFDCSATYQTLQPKKKSENNNNDDDNPVPGNIAWDTTGHTEHKTQARSQQRFPDSAPDFQGAINVSGNSVNGIDVVSPGMKYSETWVMPLQTAMSCGYISSVYTLTGTVNSVKFRCFDPGTCLFMGARGQWSSDHPYVTITFDFEARPNTNVTLPSSITGGYYDGSGYDGDGAGPGGAGGQAITKEGWQHIWFLYKPDANANTIVQKPVAVYRDTLYEKKDWAPLLIANAPGAAIAGIPGVPPAAPARGP